MVHYSTIKESLEYEGVGKYEAFAICCDHGNKRTIIHDVFTDELEAKRLTELFEREQLDAAHLEQVIEDYLQFGEV